MWNFSCPATNITHITHIFIFSKQHSINFFSSLLCICRSGVFFSPFLFLFARKLPWQQFYVHTFSSHSCIYIICVCIYMVLTVFPLSFSFFFMAPGFFSHVVRNDRVDRRDGMPNINFLVFHFYFPHPHSHSTLAFLCKLNRNIYNFTTTTMASYCL